MKIAALPATFSFNAKRLTTEVILLFLLLLLFILTLALPRQAHAQACSVQGPLSAQEAIDTLNRCAIEKDIFDDKMFNLNQMSGTTDSLYTLLFGTSQLHPETNTVTQGSGALAASGRLVAALYSAPPVSGINYFADEFRKFNPVQPAYAESTGIGFDALSPVKNIWQLFRDVSYVAFVVVFVIVGFMIMFRHRISPQTVATVQDSIPRLIVALILVTFSYAIAGLMIDFMFLFINIAINILGRANLDVNAAQNVFKESILKIVIGSWWGVVRDTAGAVGNLIGNVLDGLPGFIGALVRWLGGNIAALVVGIAVLFIVFRVFLMLLMAYVMIIVLTIAAPFFFLVQALPGNNGAKEWFKQMTANIAVFPTVVIMLLFAALLGGIKHIGGTGSTELQGKFMEFPLLGGGLDAGSIGKLIAIGFILMTPEAANMVKKFISGPGGGGGGFGAGAAVGAAVGAGAAPLGAALSRGGRAAWNYGYAGSPVGKWFGTRKQMEAERQTVTARKKLWESAKPGGKVSKEDLEKYGIGYGK